MACDLRSCVMPSLAQAHCPSCHRTFGGVTGFDKHRRFGRCTDPATLGMADNGRGVWRKPMDRPQWWFPASENATERRTDVPGTHH